MFFFVFLRPVSAVVVARGSTAKPVFERVRCPKVDASWAGKANIVYLERRQGGDLLDGSGDQHGKVGKHMAAPTGTVVGPDNLGEVVTVRPGKRGRSTAVDGGVRPSGSQEDNRDGVAAMEDDPGEVTLEQRVALLEMGGADGHHHHKDMNGNEDRDTPVLAAVKADSLVSVVTQALRSGDKALLDRCLNVSKVKVINNTARRLMPIDAAAFIKAMVERLQVSSHHHHHHHHHHHRYAFTTVYSSP